MINIFLYFCVPGEYYGGQANNFNDYMLPQNENTHLHRINYNPLLDHSSLVNSGI